MLLFFCILLVASLWFILLFIPAGKAGKKTSIVIPKGVSVSQIAEILAEKRVIRSPFIFKIMIRYTKMENSLLAGKYRMKEGMSYSQVLNTLQKGPFLETHKVTIPEGLTIEQTASLVTRATGIKEAELKDIARNRAKEFSFEFLVENPSSSLEGYLFPKTYEVLAKTSAKNFINIMLRQFGREITGLDWSAAELKGVSKYQVVIIASLIEKEAKVAAEREVVSAVIYNRLSANIPLQIDATVQYSLPAWKKKLSYEDLKVNSPYNTYLYQGLPPGPICSPGLASIKAALNPAQVDFLYYLVTGEDGSHTFTNSYEEFLGLKEQVKSNRR